MPKTVKGHWDSWGHPILDYIGLRTYYARCKTSMYVLRNYLPHRFTTIPTARITIIKKDPCEARIDLVYSAASDTKMKFLSPHAVNALRRLYRSKRAGWRVEETTEKITFVRDGFLWPVKPYKFFME